MSESFVTVSLADVPEGKMHVCSAGNREIVVCRTTQGIYALDNVCTHAYARLNEGRLRGTRLICPLHGASFDVRDGRALGAPASRPLTTHSVSVTDDQIKISVAAGSPSPLTF
jgi:3-phenylpropionate/trans-cinnamate dioxygenase ferredoxin subunit